MVSNMQLLSVSLMFLHLHYYLHLHYSLVAEQKGAQRSPDYKSQATVLSTMSQLNQSKFLNKKSFEDTANQGEQISFPKKKKNRFS